MLGLFTRDFDKLDESDLSDLAEVRKVREHIQLDYKQQPYTHNHSDAVEMLADITAMANAQGGYILIGVEEDTSQPDGMPKRLTGVQDGDTETKWIQSLCISSIDEKIPGLRVRDIPLSNGLSCVIIQVPNSPRKPHMIVHEKHRSFRIRHGRDKAYMGMQEVRNMILSMNTYRASLANFIDERRSIFRSTAAGKPWLLFMVTPIYLDIDKVDPLRADIRDYLMKAPGVPDAAYKGLFVGEPRPTLFGIEAAYPDAGLRQPYWKLLRLFRNGHLEYLENRSDDAYEDWPRRPMRFESYRMAVTLLHFLDIASHIMQFAEINEPIAITAQWENFSPSYLHTWKNTTSVPADPPIWTDQSLPIELTVADLSDL
jgi:schlafen family protein